MKKEQIENARQNWVKASKILDFKLVTPYFIKINNKETKVFAFLPEYGSPKGALIELNSSPNFKINLEFVN